MDAIPIIFEDETMVVADKPMGLPVAVAKGGASLVARLQETREGTVINAHRIDSEMSGLVVCGKTKPAADFLSGQFQNKTAERVIHGFVVVAEGEEEIATVTELLVGRIARAI
ncbi:MAG: hypothetical protein J6386_09035 [Candidatus Synoicihabitans palmerolidicus]|nr:hypothetical protein [Candidatus Synoicihabitans palmerolidicus]